MNATTGTANGREPDADLTVELKPALTGERTARFVYLNNFEVEQLWSADSPRLPGAALSFSSATVNRMEELALLLADPNDTVVLKEESDPDFRAYLGSLGFHLPQALTVDENQPDTPVTENALASPRLLARLRAMADGRTYLMPLGVSVWEERLSEATGLPLAAPSSRVCRDVNGKIYSRELAARLGLREVPGDVCRTASQLRTAIDARRRLLASGGRIVVKESLGVSGRGMVVLDGERRADQLLRLVERRVERSGDDRVDLVVEEWVDKIWDVNYQALIARDGTVRYAGHKRAVVERGVHKGHLSPVEVPGRGEEELRHAAHLLGAALYEDGYVGVVGVDAILGVDGSVYPCLEINARFNMSTYQARIVRDMLAPGHVALATTLNARFTRLIGFAQVRDALGDLLFDGTGPTGVLVNNFATLNAAAPERLEPGQSFAGRLYVVCLAPDESAAALLAENASARLARLAEDDRVSPVFTTSPLVTGSADVARV